MQSDSLAASTRRDLSLYLGVLLVILGLVLSATTLEWAVYPPGTIPSGSRRAVALLSCRLVLVGVGLYFLVKRPRVTIIHLAAFGLTSSVSAICGALVLQWLYVPPTIVSGWRSFAPSSEQNDLGYRGRRIEYTADDYVIVLLGDSHVEARALTLEAMPEQRLESNLNALGKRVRVVSVGAGGYGQDQQLLALQEYFQKFRADMVVLWQEPRNDIPDAVFRTHVTGRPKPTFWLDAGNLRGPTESLGQPLADSPVVVVALWQRLVTLPRQDREWERRLPEPYAPSVRYDGPVNKEWQERSDANQIHWRDEYLINENSHIGVMVTPRSKRTEYGLELVRALLQRISQVVAANHAKLVLFRVDDHFFSSEEDQTYVLNGRYFRVSKRQFEANWRYVHSAFRSEIIPVTVKDWKVAPDDPHYNAPATDQIMRDLANRLKSLVPDKDTVKG